MTDNEIKKALDILDRFDLFGGQRAGRELWNEKPVDVQNEDIEKFVKDVVFLKDLINRLQAENERLQAEKDNLIKTYSECQKENLKEFVKRLKSQKHICLPPIGYPVDENDWVIYEYDIDETYKEMVGEDKC